MKILLDRQRVDDVYPPAGIQDEAYLAPVISAANSKSLWSRADLSCAVIAGKEHDLPRGREGWEDYKLIIARNCDCVAYDRKQLHRSSARLGVRLGALL